MRLPLAALFGFIFLSEIPDIWSGVGALVIIFASFYIARREAQDRAPKTG
jgi:drug/metabolite transporter (DMT)-like permease